MNLNAFEEVKNRSLTEELNKDFEVNEKMNDLQNELENYLQYNKEPNRDEKFKLPIDIEVDTEKNEFGDTTILGKITIEKSVMKDIEKMQDKAENLKERGETLIKKGLEKVYDVIKGTLIEKAAEKVLGVGGKVVKTSAKTIGTIGKKIFKKL